MGDIQANGVHKALIEHWNGNAWTVQKSANIGKNPVLSGVTATSATNAWAVGSYLTDHRHLETLVEHWNGKAWKIQSSPSPRGANLSGVAAISRVDAWAVGSYFHYGKTLVERWSGRR